MPKALSKETPAQAGGVNRSRPTFSRPDILVRLTPTLRDPFGLVVVATHHPNWDSSADLLDEVEVRLSLLGNLASNGAWFLNPGFTVSSSTVSAEFFRAARHARSQWLKQVRGSISLQRETRSVVARARRSAILYALGLGAEGLHANLSLSSLSAEERQEVQEDGRTAKQLTFSGVMYIGGDPIQPRTWNSMADELLGPEPPARKSAHRRPATRSAPEPPPT